MIHPLNYSLSMSTKPIVGPITDSIGMVKTLKQLFLRIRWHMYAQGNFLFLLSFVDSLLGSSFIEVYCVKWYARALQMQCWFSRTLSVGLYGFCAFALSFYTVRWYLLLVVVWWSCRSISMTWWRVLGPCILVPEASIGILLWVCGTYAFSFLNLMGILFFCLMFACY